MFLLNQLFARLSSFSIAGPLIGPIWIAIILVALSFLRGPILRTCVRLCGIRDEQLTADIKRKLDAPLQLFLLTLAFLPFSFLIGHPAGSIVVLGLYAISLFLFFHLAIQVVDLSLFSWYLARREANVSSVVRFFVLFVLYGLSILLLLDWVFGVSVLPLLATSTIVTAVVGLALQDTLKNAFAGLNMSIEKSFVEGDWVLFRVDANEQWYGRIEEIGWRTTKIKTLNNNYAVIPNAKFTSHELINFNRPSVVHAQTLSFPVILSAEADNVKGALLNGARAVNGVLHDPEPNALPIEIKEHYIVYQLRFWTAGMDRREELAGAVLERCWKELKELGALP